MTSMDGGNIENAGAIYDGGPAMDVKKGAKSPFFLTIMHLLYSLVIAASSCTAFMLSRTRP